MVRTASVLCLMVIATVVAGLSFTPPAQASGPSPTVATVNPDSGSTAGGTSVSITGSGFSGATAVMFGSTAATSFTVNSNTSITAVAPAEPAWQTGITVSNSSGISPGSAGATFTYLAATATSTKTPHVMVIMMENESSTDIFNTGDAPNTTALAQDYGLATNSYSIGHPSEPNYLEMISGSNWGVTADDTPAQAAISSSVPTLANQLETAGISWRGYLESMPSAGYTGGDTGGPDAYGGNYYFQHHNPFVYFPAVTSLADFDNNVVPLTSVPGITSDLDASNAPDFVWVTPNTTDDMHDGPALPDGATVPTVGDAWLANFVGNIQSTTWYAAGGKIVVQWDESGENSVAGLGTAGEGGGGQIPTLVISAALQSAPQQDSTPVNTAGVLHSVEQIYGLSYLQDAANTGNGNINSLLMASPAPPAASSPVVNSVSPPSGTTNGGTSVTITGSGFTGASTVSFGAKPASSFTVDSDTEITANSPPGTSGPVDVTVSGPGGMSGISSADQFSYLAAPSVTRVSPDTGPQSSGYWIVGSDGSVYSFGGAPYEGSLPALHVHANDVVSIVPTADGGGYWMVGSDGGVFAFGDAGYVGSLPGLNVHVSDIVGTVPTADGRGYWMIGRDGGVFAFGDAGYVGSLPGLNVHVSDIVAVVPTPSGRGYWMIGRDGGVFAFGDAGYVGSLPGLNVHVSDIVGAVPTADGRGYWMVGSDGGVFAFGDAGYGGSLPGLGAHVNNVVGVVPTADDQGYLMVGSDGGVFCFGDATFEGSVPESGVHTQNIVALARP